MNDKPEFVTDDHLEFLDDLRDSGETNMLAAAPYIEYAFKIPKSEAIETLKYWMRTYSERHPA